MRPTLPRRWRRGCRPTTTVSPERSSNGRNGRRSTRRSRNRSSSSSTPSKSKKERNALATRTSLMEFQLPKIVHEELDAERGVFEIEPLDRGFGYTFGDRKSTRLNSSH